MGCGLRLRRSGSGALPTAAPVASAAVFAGRLRRALVLRIADLSSPSAWPESRSASPSHLLSETGIAKVGASEGTEQAAAGWPDFFFCFWLPESHFLDRFAEVMTSIDLSNTKD